MADVERLLAAYSPTVKSWPEPDAADDESLANYGAMTASSPAKLNPGEAWRGAFLPMLENVDKGSANPSDWQSECR